MRSAGLTFALVFCGALAQASAPETSLRPEGRAADPETVSTEGDDGSVQSPTPAPVIGPRVGSVPSPAVRPTARPEKQTPLTAADDLAPLRRPVARPAERPPVEAAKPVEADRSKALRRPVARPSPAVQRAAAIPEPSAAPEQDIVEPVSTLPAFAVPRPPVRPARVERRAARETRREARAAAAAPARAREEGNKEEQPTQKAAARATAPAAAGATRPNGRPNGLRNLFQRTAQPAYPKRGSVCGNRAIRGTTIAPVKGRIRGCGIAEPVRITEVAGVRLSTSATIDCPTAQALHSWVVNGAKPAIGRAGGGLAAVQVAAHYVCRTRNNRPGARLSEHSRGRAIDISAFVLENGQRITVLHGWRSKQNKQKLRDMHRAACGPFGTVLGPNSDRYHQDHFHFDTARYRSGPYCR